MRRTSWTACSRIRRAASFLANWRGLSDRLDGRSRCGVCSAMAVSSWQSAFVALVVVMADSASARAQETARQGRAGRIEIAGQTVACDGVRARLDRHLPNLGAAVPGAGLLILNPARMRMLSPAVQLFVFHHECGHHRVGESELEADCWAVGEGLRAGWLERNGLAQVCRSFDNAPETDTHPSGKRRCANLDRCYAKAETALAAARDKQQQVTGVAGERPEKAPSANRTEGRPTASVKSKATQTSGAPTKVSAPRANVTAVTSLVSGPKLLWSGARSQR